MGRENNSLAHYPKNGGHLFRRFGKSTVDMRFQEVCEGNLVHLLDDTMQMLEKKFLIKPVRFEGIHGRLQRRRRQRSNHD